MEISQLQLQAKLLYQAKTPKETTQGTLIT